MTGTGGPASTGPIGLDQLERCFSGAIPAVIATRAGDGTPNVTYLSRVHQIDHERVALSNQFFSKTARNLAEHPRASAIVVDPASYDEYRLTLAYERTDRRGPVFERLRKEIDDLAAMMQMSSVFRLRAADIYRVLDVEHLPANEAAPRRPGLVVPSTDDGPRMQEVADLVRQFGRCTDLDDLVSVALRGVAEVLGHDNVAILLVDDEDPERLFTIASRGYEQEGVGSDVVLGEGVVGVAAQRCETVVVGSLNQMAKYANRVRASFVEAGDVGPGHEIELPTLQDAASVLAVPVRSVGELVGVVVVESRAPGAYLAGDVSALELVAGHFAAAVGAIGRITLTRDDDQPRTAPSPEGTSPGLRVRFFEVDGSVFFDGDYVIKGVAGRVLWSLLHQHLDEGRTDFSNRELRLDPSLGLPAFRDNLDARLILLKRRLDEREAPIRLTKTGRGRFALSVAEPLRLEAG